MAGIIVPDGVASRVPDTASTAFDAGTTGPLTVEGVTSLDGIASLRQDYERLNRVTRNTLPFALHEWHLTWCRHFLNCNARISDDILFYVLRNAARECVAIVPFIVSRRWLGPLQIVAVNLLGADPAITEIREPLIQGGYEAATAREIQRQLTGVAKWDWVHWAGMDDAFAEALGKAPGMLWQPPSPAYVLDLPPTWEQFRRGLKRNIRESLRHCYNSLRRGGHSYRLQVIESPHQMRAGIDRFLKLHVKRANFDTKVAHPNRFESRVSQEFLYDVCERLAARGAVRLFQLEVDSQVVAMRLGFVVEDSLYLYYSGFDPAWARYSVMTTTLAEAIKYAIAGGLKTVNLSPTKDISKTRWGPREVNYQSAYQQGSRMRSGLAQRTYFKARTGEGLLPWFLRHLIAARHNWQ